MIEDIKKLYERLCSIAVGYLYYQSRKNTEEIKGLIPQIEKFVLWFLEENRYGIDLALYQDMCRNLIQILKDIASAMRQNDHVLLHDAVAYGLIDYLELFVTQKEKTNVAI